MFGWWMSMWRLPRICILCLYVQYLSLLAFKFIFRTAYKMTVILPGMKSTRSWNIWGPCVEHLQGPFWISADLSHLKTGTKNCLVSVGFSSLAGGWILRSKKIGKLHLSRWHLDVVKNHEAENGVRLNRYRFWNRHFLGSMLNPWVIAKVTPRLPIVVGEYAIQRLEGWIAVGERFRSVLDLGLGWG